MTSQSNNQPQFSHQRMLGKVETFYFYNSTVFLRISTLANVSILITYYIVHITIIFRSVTLILMEKLKIHHFLVDSTKSGFGLGYLATGSSYGGELSVRLLGAKIRCRIRKERSDSTTRQGLVRFGRRVDK